MWSWYHWQIQSDPAHPECSFQLAHRYMGCRIIVLKLTARPQHHRKRFAIFLRLKENIRNPRPNFGVIRICDKSIQRFRQRPVFTELHFSSCSGERSSTITRPENENGIMCKVHEPNLAVHFHVLSMYLRERANMFKSTPVKKIDFTNVLLGFKMTRYFSIPKNLSQVLRSKNLSFTIGRNYQFDPDFCILHHLPFEPTPKTVFFTLSTPIPNNLRYQPVCLWITSFNL